MKYRHHFHAGNFSDFWKHLIWFWSLTYLQKNPTPVTIVDTHSGMGFYPLEQLSQEFHEGIDLFLKHSDFAKTAAASYYQMLQDFAQVGILPGSPLLAQTIKRNSDELWLFENNDQIFENLFSLKKKAPKTHIKQCDGLKALSELLHCPLKRLAILIDPAYERPEEYLQIAELLTLIHTKKPLAFVALWYPLGKRAQLLEPLFEKMSLWPDKHVNIIYEKKHSGLEGGLTASGMILLNPPYLLTQWVDSISEMVLDALLIETHINLPSYKIAQKFGIHPAKGN